MDTFSPYLLLFFLVSYLIGSFPTAYFVVKKSTSKDIRKEETGNVGAMNTARTTGRTTGKFYLFLGQFVGTIFLPFIGYFLFPEYFLLTVLCAIPVFIKQWPRVIPMLKRQRAEVDFSQKEGFGEEIKNL